MSKLCVSLLLLSQFLAASRALCAERKPLPGPELKKIEHEPTGTRTHRDPKSGKWEEYQVDGEIIYDERTGNFLVRWTGRDGQRKTIVYQVATRLDAVVMASAEYDPDENAYRYSYVLKNLPSSRRKLQSLYLETQASVRNVTAPDSSWYSRAFTAYNREVFKASNGWAWADTLRGRAGLLPGEEASGMSFLSSGLPSVVKCYVRHYSSSVGVGEEMPRQLSAAIRRVGWKIPHGVTVGPLIPSERIHPAAFARKILGMLDVSVQQGWIESPSVAQEMRVLLGNAAAAFDRGELERASDVLESLLKRVEEENQQTLLSEAYALLRFNVEFLLAHLGEK